MRRAALKERKWWPSEDELEGSTELEEAGQGG